MWGEYWGGWGKCERKGAVWGEGKGEWWESEWDEENSVGVVK